MKTAIYPGSFSPFHSGHANVLDKALGVFSKVYIARGINPDKTNSISLGEIINEAIRYNDYGDRIEVVEYSGLLKYFIAEHNNKQYSLIKDGKDEIISCIIKGIRDTNDFLYEQKMQYWNEDLGITIPTMYIISDRKLVHMSSSAIRSLERFK